jgi:hypothetical protein
VIRAVLAGFAALATACDLQPPPRQKPAPTTATATADAAAPAVPPDADDRVACTAIANHIADVYIAAADQTSRVALDHDRSLLVQKTIDACMPWSDEIRRCYAAAPDPASLDRCAKLRVDH